MKYKIEFLFSLLTVSVTFSAFTFTADTTNTKESDSRLSIVNQKVSPENKFDLTYVLDPDNIIKEDYQRAMSEFRQKGFELGFSESYKEEDLEQLKISLGSNWNKVSATYQIDELRKKQYIIFIGANTDTGDVIVISQSPEK